MSDDEKKGSFLGRLLGGLIKIAIIVALTTVLIHKNNTEIWAWEAGGWNSYVQFITGQWEKSRANIGELTADIGKRVKPWAEKAWAEGQASFQALSEKYSQPAGGEDGAAAPEGEGPGGSAEGGTAEPRELPEYVKLRDKGRVDVQAGLKAYQTALTSEGESARAAMKQAKTFLEQGKALLEEAQTKAPAAEKGRFDEELQNIQKLLHAVIKNSSV